MAQKFLTNIDLNKNELQNAKVQNLGTAPSDPADGQIYFDTVDNALKIWDGSGWVNLHEGDISAVNVTAPITGGGTSGAVTIGLATSGVSAGSYGSATEIPTFTVDSFGRLSAASTVSISTTLSFTDDSSTAASVALNGGTLSILGGTGLTTTANDSSDSITVTLDNTSVSAGSYGAANTIPTFTVDAQGRLTAAGTATITLDIAADTGTDDGVLVGTDVLTISGGTGVDTSVTGDTITVAIGQAVGTTDDVTFNTVSADLTGDVTGNADTATALQTARTIAISGDVVGSASFDGTANIDISATIQADSVALGTDTTGNYMVDVSAGTGVTVSHTQGEGSTATVSIGQAVAASDSPTFAGATLDAIQVGITAANEIDTSAGNLILDSASGTVEVDDNLTVSGNLIVNGTTTTVNSTIITVDDSLLMLADGNTSTDSIDIGFYGVYDPAGTDLYTGLFRDSTDGKWKLFTDLEVAPGTSPNIVDTTGTGYTVATLVTNVEGDVTGDLTGDVLGNVTGDLTGNADTATALETARTIQISGDVAGSASFDGTANINISATVQPDSVALGTDTTGNYMSDVSAGTGVTVTHTPDEGSTATIAIGQAVGTSDNVTFNNITASGTVTVDSVAIDAVQTSAEAFSDSDTALMTAAAVNDRFTRHYTTDVGDDASTSIDVSHNLGTKNVIVEVYEISSGDTVMCDVTRTDNNTVTLGFATAPASDGSGNGTLQVVIIGM
jgi:hypothetical protein